MIVANHQPQYLPYLGFFHKIRRCDHLVILDDVQFLDRGHQHRNLIKMQTGTQWLTVPVLRKRGQLIRDVAIDPTSSWKHKHWAALVSNYSPAPYWKQLSPQLHAILVEQTHAHLLPLDLALLRWIMSVLEIDIPITLSSSLGVTSQSASEHHIEICRAVGADTYLSGAGGRAYMDLAVFEAAGIRVEFQDYAAREYPQRFPQHGFIANLSVVDALFNLGTEAKALIA